MVGVQVDVAVGIIDKIQRAGEVNRLVVEQDLRAPGGDLAHTEVGGCLVQRLGAIEHRRRHFVQLRVVQVPKDRILDFQYRGGPHGCDAGGRSDGQRLDRRENLLAIGGHGGRAQLKIAIVPRWRRSDFQFHLGRLIVDIGLDKNIGNISLARDFNPRTAPDSAHAQEGRFRIVRQQRGIGKIPDLNRQRVFLAIVHQVGDIDGERLEGAFVLASRLAVDEKLGAPVHPHELDRDALTARVGRDVELPLVPRRADVAAQVFKNDLPGCRDRNRAFAHAAGIGPALALADILGVRLEVPLTLEARDNVAIEHGRTRLRRQGAGGEQNQKNP